ncbi:hypothetical protein LY78DRAFT_654584 [Colletotrichum sublineola]|nr:hypothetical protein LY78DRAFT_654584 [Colletotrichum sublineola]
MGLLLPQSPHHWQRVSRLWNILQSIALVRVGTDTSTTYRITCRLGPVSRFCLALSLLWGLALRALVSGIGPIRMQA